MVLLDLIMESGRAGLMSRSFLSDAEQQRPGRQARIRNSFSVVSLALFGWAFLAVLEFQQTNQPQPNLPAAPSRFKQGTGLREMQVSDRRSSHELPNGWADQPSQSSPASQTSSKPNGLIAYIMESDRSASVLSARPADRSADFPVKRS